MIVADVHNHTNASHGKASVGEMYAAAKDRGLAGVVDPASAYFCKHPRKQITDDLAKQEVEAFIAAA